MQGPCQSRSGPLTQHFDDPRRQPIFQSPGIVLATIGLLAAVHAALAYAGPDWRVWSYYALAFYGGRYGAQPEAMLPGSEYWTLVTYALLHGDWMHLAFNSLWLLVFGTVTARYLGAVRFVALSVIAAFGGALVTLALHWGEPYLMVGASGSVSGMMAAAVPIMYGRGGVWSGWSAGDPATTRPLSPRELLGNRNAIVFTLVWLAITLFSGAGGFISNSFGAGGGIAWEAHIGGFAAGLAAFYLLQPRKDGRRRVL